MDIDYLNDTFFAGVRLRPTFQNIVDKCKKEGKKWTDPDFPPKDESIYSVPGRPPRGWPKITGWKRVTEFGPKVQLFVDGTDPGDVIQGVLGDCWFIGALGAVAAREELIYEVFQQVIWLRMCARA
eukprot:TRINITY_DN5681_c1_g2_i4.p2 TRINITY_DN5681_c1_g2~~TRINITY_DN5681_c1_g2_i4.p2  ORF type:complete len:126 (+),score=12.16 TRINITY_DN5681_c1_g2_i4:100-477(+)